MLSWFLFAEARDMPDPSLLPMATHHLSDKPDAILLPQVVELELEPWSSEAELGYCVVSSKGEAELISAKGSQSLKPKAALVVFDRLSTGPKSSLVLEDGAGFRFEIGASTMVQVVKSIFGHERLRLLKGRLRVIAPGEVASTLVESLTAEVMVHRGVVDVMITAMNTLVAPREGSGVDVESRKSKRRVEVGCYGLVMADGSVLLTKAKGG
jgi:hypothetical protein